MRSKSWEETMRTIICAALLALAKTTAAGRRGRLLHRERGGCKIVLNRHDEMTQ
jgi:hypothetical protein